MAQFILTRSVSPSKSMTRYSGAGRVAPVNMRLMSFLERGISAHTMSFRSSVRAEHIVATKPKAKSADFIGMSYGLRTFDPPQSFV